MAKNLIIVAVVLVVAAAAWFYLRGPAGVSVFAPAEEGIAPEESAPERQTGLTFDANDNLDQALKDLQTLGEEGIE